MTGAGRINPPKISHASTSVQIVEPLREQKADKRPSVVERQQVETRASRPIDTNASANQSTTIQARRWFV